MEPISNADRLVLLLRRKLEEKRAADARASSKTDRTSAPTGMVAVRAIAAVQGVDERIVRRGVVQNLLAEELGPELLNDAQFQQVVSRVTEAIEEDNAGARLLSDVMELLRRS